MSLRLCSLWSKDDQTLSNIILKKGYTIGQKHLKYLNPFSFINVIMPKKLNARLSKNCKIRERE